MRKRRRALVLLVFFLFFYFITSIQTVSAKEAPKESELYAKAAVLMDGDSGRVLYSKNGEEPLANASTTKILTCILALENCDLDSEIPVSGYASSQPKVHLGMKEGQVFRMRDLLYGLMLESFNDCAVAIAEFVAGDTTHFAEMMNDKAREIGCKDSYFITPNGLDAKEGTEFHHTTAEDLALIMRYCITQSPASKDFLAITGTNQYEFTDCAGNYHYQCSNHNAFLQMMEGAISGKTGFTGSAGYCYVGALKQQGKTLIVALLACGWPNNKSYKWSDTKKLMNYGLENFQFIRFADVSMDNSRLMPIPVNHGQTNNLEETVYVSIKIADQETENPNLEGLLLAPEEHIRVTYEIAKQLSAPVSAGMCVGRIRYIVGETVWKEWNVVTERPVLQIDYPWCFKQVLKMVCLW